MKKHLIYWLAAFLIVIVSCQKELSFEGSNTPAEGSLQADVTGDCLPKTVNGTYVKGIQLVPATNTITVEVNVTKTGTYLITTDTLNGFYFRGTGTFTKLGATNVTLRGNGTPFQSNVTNFVVNFDSTFCDIQVTVISPGDGILSGSPNACAPIQVNGGYSPGVALTANNNVVVEVNVTTPGIFSITTDTLLAGNLWFSFSGTLSFGVQNVTLHAQGSIPAGTATGPKTFTVKLGTSSCTFVVTVAGPAAGTVDCSAAIISGNYTATVPMNASNTVDISVNVTTAGAYNITTDTMNGVWFNASGNFPTAPATVPVTLTAGISTPANPGTFTYTVKFGTSTCTFQVVFTGIDWQFTVVGGNLYKGSTFYDTLYVPAAPFTFYSYEGDNGAGDDIIFDLYDLVGGITNTEQYSATSTGTTNACDFSFQDAAGNLDLSSNPGPPSVGTMVFTITSHNTATKTIKGTFSGTAFDSISGTMKTISGGTFTAVYP